MPLQLIVGGTATAAANETLYWTITFPGEKYVGPIDASANFESGDNYGTVTTVQTSVNSFEDTSLPSYYPQGTNYTSVLRNDTAFSVIYNLSIGWFT